MRQTPTYFAGKMGLMFRRNVLYWLNESICINEDEQIAKQKARMYYHYHSSSDVGTIFKNGRVISWFTLKNITSSEIISEKIIIAF
jgi:hypothetical protein